LHDGKLTSAHIPAVTRIGRKIADLDWMPDVVLVSDAVRATETWGLMEESLRSETTLVSFHGSLYLAALDAIQDLVGSVAAKASTLMVVGHNPGWERATATLVGQEHRMTTCNAAMLTVDAEDWVEALNLEACWTLEHMLRPKEL
ncbi:MAG: hypothetical protein AAGA56_28205, partial [Myxococcota bacterium]